MSVRAASAATLIAAAASLLALASAIHAGPHVWRELDQARALDAPLTVTQRRQAPATALQIPGAIFDFFASYIGPGDRIYYQVLPSGFSEDLTLPQAIATLGNFYLLPGVQTTNLADATVVISWFANPAALHLHFVTQVEAGVQPLYVSRIRAP